MVPEETGGICASEKNARSQRRRVSITALQRIEITIMQIHDLVPPSELAQVCHKLAFRRKTWPFDTVWQSRTYEPHSINWNYARVGFSMEILFSLRMNEKPAQVIEVCAGVDEMTLLIP